MKIEPKPCVCAFCGGVVPQITRTDFNLFDKVICDHCKVIKLMTPVRTNVHFIPYTRQGDNDGKV